jgi:hypothetical protein
MRPYNAEKCSELWKKKNSPRRPRYTADCNAYVVIVVVAVMAAPYT